MGAGWTPTATRSTLDAVDLDAVGVRSRRSHRLHVAGGAAYTDDIALPSATLHAALGLSGPAHARLLALDLEKVKASPGVVAVAAAADIPTKAIKDRLGHHVTTMEFPAREKVKQTAWKVEWSVVRDQLTKKENFVLHAAWFKPDIKKDWIHVLGLTFLPEIFSAYTDGTRFYDIKGFKFKLSMDGVKMILNRDSGGGYAQNISGLGSGDGLDKSLASEPWQGGRGGGAPGAHPADADEPDGRVDR